MGIKKLANGKYKVDYMFSNGKRKRQTFQTKKDAEAFHSKLNLENYENKKIQLGLARERVLIENEISRYIESKKQRATKTLQKVKCQSHHFLDFCNNTGLIYLDEINKNIAREYKYLLTNEKFIKSKNNLTVRSTKTINDYLINIKSFFKKMVRYDVIDKNPFDIVECLPKEKRKAEYYTREELISIFKQDIKLCYKDIFMTLLDTGMRIGELVNLKWKNIDFERELIKVEESVDFKPKTINSIRNIPISIEVMSLLKRLAGSGTDKEEYVFKSPNGSKVNPRRVLEQIKIAGEKAGIKSKITVHKFRSTFGSNLANNNTSQFLIKSLLGHSSIDQTEQYVHTVNENLHDEVNKVSFSSLILKHVS